jgi:agmatinase
VTRPDREVALLGLPYDASSSFLRGPAEAPLRIREALASDVGNGWTESGLDLRGAGALISLGDAAIGDDPVANIERAAAVALASNAPVLFLGGDHSVTYPVVRAVHALHRGFTILHLDAHPDLYDELDGDRFSHACPFARIMEERLADRLVQVGIRTMNAHQRAQAERFSVEVIDMDRWVSGVRPQLSGPVYITLDLDVLDPAFAPGISHWEPGGLSTRELITLLHALDVPVLSADLVEYNPRRDPTGVTADVCAKLVRELAGIMLRALR